MFFFYFSTIQVVKSKRWERRQIRTSRRRFVEKNLYLSSPGERKTLRLPSKRFYPLQTISRRYVPRERAPRSVRERPLQREYLVRLRYKFEFPIVWSASSSVLKGQLSSAYSKQRTRTLWHLLETRNPSLRWREVWRTSSLPRKKSKLI